MLILNGSWTYIHFSHDKMGRKISEGNAVVYCLYKSPIGFRILLTKQTFVHYTSTFNVIENVNEMHKWLNNHVCLQYLHVWASKTCVCLVTSLITLLFVLPWTLYKIG